MLAIVLTLVGAVAGDPFRVSNALGDAMVLQRGEPVALWGVGAAVGGPVRVTVGGQSFTGSADSSGAWVASNVGPFEAGDHGVITITDSSNANITLSDVLWGDVFLCSGQVSLREGCPIYI